MVRTRIVLGAIAGLLAGPAFAADVLVDGSPPPSGSPVYAAEPMIAADVGLGLGYFWWDDDISRFDYETGEVWGAGRINFRIGGGGLNQELEASGLAGFVDDSYYSYGAFSHTYWKNSAAAAGLLLGASNIAGYGALTAGAEAAVFMPSATLVGLLAYTWGDDGLPDFWTASGEGRWYWNPNTKLTGTVTYNDLNDAWMLSAGAEHRIAGTMAGIFADATYYTNDTGNGWELFAGGRLFFAKPGQTLQGHDHDVPFAAARAITF